MKANQKFLNNDDDAVSPVIAVILMVAITVVLAATVYVWVSGFGSQSSQPAKSISLSSAGALASGEKGYVVSSATSGMKYSDFTVTVDGANFPIDASAVACASSPAVGLSTEYVPCRGTTDLTTSGIVTAGDIIWIKTVAAGQTLRLLDSSANSVMLTLTVG